MVSAGDTEHYKRPQEASFNSFFAAYGVILFAYGGHAIFPTLQVDMKEPNRFPIAIAVSFALILCIYVPTATAGFYAYGGGLQGTFQYVTLLCYLYHSLSVFIIVCAQGTFYPSWGSIITTSGMHCWASSRCTSSSR